MGVLTYKSQHSICQQLVCFISFIYFIEFILYLNAPFLILLGYKNHFRLSKKSVLLIIEVRDGVNTFLKVNNNNWTPNEINIIMDVETSEKGNNTPKDMGEKKIWVFYMILLSINILLKFKSVEH